MQCGDLLYAHTFPAYRSMNKARSLTLLYNSAAARPTPTVAVDFATYIGESVPDKLHLVITKNGQRLASAYYTPVSTTGSSNQVHRLAIAIPPDSATLGTGAHSILISVSRLLSGDTLATDTASATLLVVDRRTSPFGAGWWPAGIEQLYPGQDAAGSALLVLGDGSALYFRKQPNGTFTSPPGEHSTLSAITSGRFKRVMPGGRVTMWYSSAGRIDSLTDNNPTRNKATYTWSGGLLTSITDPVGKSITLSYTSSRLTGISVPGVNAIAVKQRNRSTDPTTFFLDTIVDPDGYKIKFRYDSVSHRRMVLASPRAHGSMLFRYDTVSATVDSVSYPIANFNPTRIRAWQRWGASTKTTGSFTTPAAAAKPEESATIFEMAWYPSLQEKWDTAWFRVDRSGAPIRIYRPIAGYSRIDRDSIGQPVYIRSPRGAEVWQEWSDRGQLLRSIASGIRGPTDTATSPRYDTTTYEYDATWWGMTRSVNAERDTVWVGYDGYGRQDWVKNGRYHTSHFDYTARGLTSTITEPNAAGTGSENYPTVYTYDPTTLNITNVTDSTGMVRYKYNGAGSDVIGVINAEGDSTGYAYDAIKRALTVTRAGPNGGASVVSYGFNDASYQRTQTDPNGEVSTWTSDAVGRLTTRCVRASWCETYEFWDGRNPTKLIKRDGIVHLMTYDAAGHVTQKKLGLYGEDDIIDYAYDSDGNLTGVTNKYSHIQREYDPYGRLIWERQGIKEWLGTYKHYVDVWHAYDRTGRRRHSYLGNTVEWQRVCTPFPVAGDTLPDCIQPWALVAADSISYAYDHAGNLASIVNTLWRITPADTNGTWDYSYDGKERLTQLSVPSGATVNWSYDNDDRLVQYWKSSSGPDDVLARDAAGRVITQVSAGLNRTDQFEFDALGQLVDVGSTHDPDAFTYDSSGNRLTDSRWTYTYNSKGQLTDKDDGTCWLQYTYDQNGNQLASAWQSAPCSGELRQTMTYDKGDRMVTSEEVIDAGANPGSRRRSFWYDGLGRRILMYSHDAVASDVGVWRYWWLDDNVAVKTYNIPDTTGPTPPIDLWWPWLERNQNSEIEGEGEWYYYGPGVDNVLASWNHGSDSTKRYLFFKDYRGSVVHVTRADGVALGLTASSYTAFGGASGSPPSQAGTNPGYNGHEMAGGLVYMRNRWYDPNTGRFTQEDPIGYAGGVNLYGYAGGDPVTYSDPFGLCPEEAQDGDVCLDFYIPDSSAAGFKGDARGSDPNAPPNASRVQIVVNGVGSITFMHASESCGVLLGCRPAYGINTVGGNQIRSTTDAEGNVNITMRAYNSAAGGLAPAIDASVTIRPDGSTSGVRDAFPALDIYTRSNGRWELSESRPAHSPLSLFPGMPKDRW